MPVKLISPEELMLVKRYRNQPDIFFSGFRQKKKKKPFGYTLKMSKINV